VPGWPPGEQDQYQPILLDCFARGGFFLSGWDGGQLAGVVVVDPKPLGAAGDLVQLEFLHVGRPYRKQGLATRFFHAAEEVARELGASGLYISATPSENTINFYVARGCTPSPHPDPELFELEPEDIHLELRF
jgi:GNAT superfamily N-acetyltransferase